MLTDEDIRNLYEKPNESPLTFARAIESAVLAKLREENDPVAQINFDAPYGIAFTQEGANLKDGTILFANPVPSAPEVVHLSDIYEKLAAARSGGVTEMMVKMSAKDIDAMMAEIKTLTAERDQWRTDCRTYYDVMRKREDQIVILRADNARLRAALERIADHEKHIGAIGNHAWGTAQEALKGQP